MMINFKNLIIFLVTILLFESCVKNVEKNEDFTIRYINQCFFEINIYAKNDTIFLSNFENNKYKSIKIKSNKTTINKIKRNINEILNLDFLKLKRDVNINSTGIMTVKKIGENKISEINFKKINNNLEISNDFNEMISDLKESNEKIENIFPH